MCSQGVPDLELLERGWTVKQVEPEPGYIGPEPVFLYRHWPVMDWVGQYFARRHEGLPNDEEQESMENPRVERLAAHCHDEQWSGWMEYLFSKCTINEDGSATIPASWYWRWAYQSAVSYSDLPEDMKESDREEARAILELVDNLEETM